VGFRRAAFFVWEEIRDAVAAGRRDGKGGAVFEMFQATAGLLSDGLYIACRALFAMPLPRCRSSGRWGDGVIVNPNPRESKAMPRKRACLAIDAIAARCREIVRRTVRHAVGRPATWRTVGARGALVLLAGVWGMVRGDSAEVHVDAAYTGAYTDGSAEFPFRTLADASAVLMPGDTCLIHAGTYREVLSPPRSGTAGAPIRYQAAGDGLVVVTATDPVENWQPGADGIYVAEGVEMPLGKANMLHFRQAAQQLARWPNDADGDPYTYDALKIRTEAGTYSDSYITHDAIPDYWTSGVMFWLGAHSGCAVQRAVTGYDPATHRLSFTPFPSYWPFGTHSPNRWENGHRGIFYLMGRLEALDAPGEWYYDEAARRLHFMPPSGADPREGGAEITVRNRTLNLAADHIHIEGIAFYGAPLQINGSDCVLSRLHVLECVNQLITDEDSAVAGGAAVLVYGKRNRIEHCLVEEGTATGINIGMNADDTVVENCIIRNFDKQGNHCSPIRSSGRRALITRNRISGSARDVSRCTGQGSEFSYNEVFDGLLANTDGGLFYVTGNSVPVDVELHHNWFHGAHSPDYTSNHSTGIYLDNDSAGYLVHHNVVWDVAWGGLHFNWDAIENKIYNNTFWEVGIDPDTNEPWALILSWIPVLNGVPTDVRDNIIINNLSDMRPWWDSGAGAMREDETLDNTFRNNRQAEQPPFESYESLFFSLRDDPRFVDAGEVIPGITDGYKGAAPDIGAYERGGDFWVPGPDWDAERGPFVIGSSRLVNLSVRTALAEAQNLIVGFVTAGGSRDILLRAIGPGLEAFVEGFHPNPRLQLFREGTEVAVNDDWPAGLRSSMDDVGAFPLAPGSRDAAVLYTLHGACSAHVNGPGSGMVLVEAYDAGGDAGAELVNVSARNLSGRGNDVLIAGFVIEGDAPRTVLVRGVGPTLRQEPFEIGNAIGDTRVAVFDADGGKVAENDRWPATLLPLFKQLGAFPLLPGSDDAALRVVLAPGAYTAQVSSADGSVGEALVEIYVLP